MVNTSPLIYSELVITPDGSTYLWGACSCGVPDTNWGKLIDGLNNIKVESVHMYNYKT